MHRDVSPQNILVGADGITRVTDFGIARAKSRLVNTGHGEVKGKFGYMSPEQVRTQPVDARSDLFAMGVVLWEAIAQKRLFYGSPVDVVAAVAAHRIRDIREEVPSTPPALVAVLDKALQREPATRYQTARAFADAIDVALRGDNHVGDAHDVGSFVRQSFARQLAERRAAVKRMAHDTIVSSGPKPFELPDALAIPAPRVVSPMAYEATQPGAKVTPSHHADADAHQITERSEARTSSSPSNTDRVTSERITVPMIRPRVPQSVTTPPMPAPAPSIPPIAARISHPPGTEIDDDDFYGRAATSTMDANDAPPEVRALLDGYHALMAQPRPVASAASAGIAPARAVPPSPAPASTASAHASAPLSQPSLPPPPAYPSYPSYPSAPIVPSPSRARTWIAVLVFAFVSAAAISWVFVARK